MSTRKCDWIRQHFGGMKRKKRKKPHECKTGGTHHEKFEDEK
jgi:hypothetical protein